MPEYVSAADYARHRQCSRQAVHQAIKAGRIVTFQQEGKMVIDPEVADIQWAKNTDQKQFERANSAKIAAAVPPEPASQRSSKRGSAEGEDSGTVYWDARARREAAEAEKAEIELEKLRGSVADREGMHRGAMALGRMLRDSMLGIPPKVAPEYAGMVDPFEIERHLEATIRRILEDVSALTVDDMNRAMQ